MAVLDAKQISKSLKKKGFVESEGDHTFYTLYVDGIKTRVRTKLSHGETEIGDTLISLMQKQTFLSKKDFLRLIECPMSKEEYINKLIEENVILL